MLFLPSFPARFQGLKELPARSDLTQEDLAAKVGVSRQTIVAIEKQKYDHSLSLAFKLARCFGVKIEDIFQEE
jgi:putative transcriptional regulator